MREHTVRGHARQRAGSQVSLPVRAVRQLRVVLGVMETYNDAEPLLRAADKLDASLR